MITDKVNPFFGWGEMDLPPAQGVAASWFFIKAQCGNTHPGASLPFEPVSVLPYSGAYPTGYGTHMPNFCGKVPKLYRWPCASGFTHFQQSGTGFIDIFYNYVKVSPVNGPWLEHRQLHDLEDENAQPGWYKAKLKDTGIMAELTVARMAAVHRYTFEQPISAKIVVDFSAGGLCFPDTVCRNGLCEVLSSGRDQINVRLEKEGVPLFAHVRVAGADSMRIEKQGQATIGVFDLAGDVAEVRIGFSCQSDLKAIRHVEALESFSFEDLKNKALAQWTTALSVIQAEFNEPERAGQFYSMLYHALKKPCDLSDENPFGDWPYYTDLATLWDMYKTQLPLVATLYPERMKGIVNAYLDTARHLGFFPNALFMADRFDICKNQARGLFYQSIADAFFRRVPGIDYREALKAMKMDIDYAGNQDFRLNGTTSYPVHTLDLSCACQAGRLIAGAIGERQLEDYFAGLTRNWKKVMANDGLMPADHDYYEGSNRNYSFRILPDMRARMALFPSPADFVAALDDFFGFGARPVVQAGYACEPAGMEQMRAGCKLARFEGINNEPDMDAPYNYAWAGRHDRVCEVIHAACVSVFSMNGPGALPGNDDSGALTSWFVWNTLGIFPITGRDLFLIGSPMVRHASLKLAAGLFDIDVAGCGIYVKRAFLNNVEIKRSWLTVNEVMKGGRLQIIMSEQPTDFGACELPD